MVVESCDQIGNGSNHDGHVAMRSLFETEIGAQAHDDLLASEVGHGLATLDQISHNHLPVIILLIEDTPRVLLFVDKKNSEGLYDDCS
jgi:hypothetical protein